MDNSNDVYTPESSVYAKPQTPKRKLGTFEKTLLALVVGGVALWGAVAAAGSSSSAIEPAAPCGHFRAIAGDINQGLLSNTEIRDKFIEVRSSAFGTPVYSEATGMVSAMTTGTVGDLMIAMGSMDAACDTAGF